MQFSGFNPQQKFAILQRMGYNGSTQEDEMNAYITSRPEAASKIRMYEAKAREMMNLPTPEPVNMAKGGVAQYQPPDYFLPGVYGPGEKHEVNPKYTDGVENVYETPNDTGSKLKFDENGFFGDPNRMRQDLNFDPATGTYSPIGMIPSTGLPEARLEITDGQPLGPSIGVDANTGNVVKGNDLSQQYYTDYDNPRSDAQLQEMYKKAQADAKAQRDSGFMGRVQLPGEMPFENFAEMNRYQILPVGQSAPMQAATGGAIGTGGSGPSEAYSGEVAAPQVAMLTPQQDQLVQPLADQQATQAGVATVAQAAQADVVGIPEAATVDAAMASGDVQKVTAATQAVQGAVSQQIDAAQGESSVQNAQAAQGAAIMMNNPAQREIQQGELISGSADAQKAAQFSEQIEAAQASPSQKATVQGQLDSLMQDFEGGETPAWAAGAMRAATAQMAARGLGSSSLAGQAIVQAAMESALPIAMADAQTIAQFEAQNLSNRQQRAMLAAQQRAEFIGMEFSQDFQARVANSARIGEIANMNFTAEQQIALENSRAANTMNLTNLSNDQAMVMAQVAALSQMDMANLNNRQQAAVQNAQNFLQMDLTNLSNEQQTSMFKAQQNIQALFTDQAAENAAQQFNAASDNQVTQFFADLQANVSKFNADQQNAIAQSNVNAVNATQQFNTTQNNAFRQFMISNNLAVAQANAQWRQTAATLNQEAANEANMETAKTLNAFTASALDEIWQRERDELDYVFSSYQNDQDRANAIILQKLAADASMDAAKLQNDIATNQTIGKVFFDILFPK